jgi:hypothetical protein
MMLLALAGFIVTTGELTPPVTYDNKLVTFVTTNFSVLVSCTEEKARWVCKTRDGHHFEIVKTKEEVEQYGH